MSRWNASITNPPLTITEEQLREGFEIIDRALDITDAAVEGSGTADPSGRDRRVGPTLGPPAELLDHGFEVSSLFGEVVLDQDRGRRRDVATDDPIDLQLLQPFGEQRVREWARPRRGCRRTGSPPPAWRSRSGCS